MNAWRGKRIDTKDWTFGDLVQGKNGERFIANAAEAVTWGGEKFLSIGQWCEVVPETVGRFTGRYDDQGTEIYTGDKIAIPLSKVSLDITLCEIIEQPGGFAAKWLNPYAVNVRHREISEFPSNTEVWRIVGNIYGDSMSHDLAKVN